MAALVKDQFGFYHPGSEDDLCQLIQRASRDGVPIRVRGACLMTCHWTLLPTHFSPQGRRSHAKRSRAV